MLDLAGYWAFQLDTLLNFQGMGLQRLSFQGLSFQRPGWLLLILPVLLLLVWQRYSYGASQRWRNFIDPQLLAVLLQAGQQPEQRQLRTTSLALLTVLCWVLVLSGPRWHGLDAAETIPRMPLVINLALDDSMLQQDVAPSRLALAKLQLQEVLQQHSGSEVALQVFAGSSHRVLPLTEDSDSLLWYLKYMQPALMPQKGWQPLAALRAGNELLQRSGVKGQQLLITGYQPGLAAGLAAYPADASPVLVWSLAAGPPQARLSLPGSVRHYSLRTVDPSLPGLNDWFSGHSNPPEEAEGALELGYYLCWLLLLPTLFWFRRGRLLQWQ